MSLDMEQRPTPPADCYIAIPDGASLAGLLAHDTPEEAEKDVQVWADAGIAGSVRHFREVAPSGPSQDSQEVDLAGIESVIAMDKMKWWGAMCKRCGWIGSSENAHGGESMPEGAGHSDVVCPKCMTPVDDFDLLKNGVPALIAEIRRLRALSQSPKGAAGAVDDANMWELEYGEPSAPKTGLRGAARLDAHPIQPLALDASGVLRFKKNEIVRFLLDDGPFDMNKLAVMPFSREDRVQFAQLIGYSLHGFGELNYVTDADYDAAEKMRPEAPSSAPLSEAKGPDLPPSSQPAPGDVEDDDTDHITNNPNVIEARQRWEREQAAKGGDVGEAGGGEG